MDFREKIEELDERQRARVVGASNYKLIQAGKADWSDVVTEGRIRDFREVVSLKRLDVKTLMDAGVRPKIAADAYRAVHTAAHEIAEESRRRLVQALKDKGVDVGRMKRIVAERLAGRVSIGEGPSGAQALKITPTPIQPPPVKPLPLVQLKLALKLAKVVVPVVKPTPPIVPKPGEPILPGRPIEERLAAYTEGDRKLAAVKAIGEEIADLAREVETLANEHQKLVRKLKDPMEGTSAYAPVQESLDRRNAAYAKLKKANDMAGERVLKILEVPDADRASFVASKGDVLSRPLQKRANGVIKKLGRIMKEGEVAANMPGDVAFDFRLNTQERAFYRPRHGAARNIGDVSINDDTPDKTIAHELGHGIEHQVKGVHDAVLAFDKLRFGNEAPQQLSKLFPGRNFNDDEFGRKDKMDKAFSTTNAFYVGKVYPGKDHTEILSMGIEALFDHPAFFIQRDPEYAKFVFGILDGSLR